MCYNAYGVFKDKEMYEKYFGDEVIYYKVVGT